MKSIESWLKPLTGKKKLTQGVIVRRTGNGKDQQGSFLEYDRDGNIILINIIDLATGTLISSMGVLKPRPGDQIYYSTSSFETSPAAKKALALVREWSLFQKHARIQEQIIDFIGLSYVPEQVLKLAETNSLNFLFVPVQQKFRIGRFTERRSLERVCNDIFLQKLQVLHQGNHITYLALVLHQKHYIPRFYSAGTKPHDETTTLLKDEEFNFHPSHGGHMKVDGTRDGKKHFLVDAGSNVYGRGVKTPLHVSEQVVEGLKKVFPEFEYTAMAGRGAFGTEQSY
ncbi:MAG TPA: hypothetical protein PK307_12955 [Spirochaetota bacterium]|nr:hypothetical protein [Spirochaetota bacterium]HOD15738.1 hypothetical protein [Spirochaetota bacterium]HPG50072.1 hypothetical protein [Spirochaetota bacterium]HPN12154.1 hypothetical protein [Spirochaetota bacterium]HQL83107.1 hypothetical protein [Spirochaetota bacterium]